LLLATAIALAVTVLTGGDAAPAAARSDYILLPRSELLSLPMRGKAWDYMVGIAHAAWEAPELDDQDNRTNVKALAAALVYARTGDTAMRAKARQALVAMIPTYDLSQDGGLGPARQIAGWVLVADFIGLSGSDDNVFRGLLRRALTQPIGSHPRWGGSLIACQEDADTNWGAWCSASRIAAALYLGDSTQLGRANRVLRGFLGDRKAWSHFRGQGSENGVLTPAIRSWSCDASPGAYVPTNPQCGDRSGAFPGDAARSGKYRTLNTMYQSETTAAVALATELLYRNGYPHAWAFRGALARVAKFDYHHGAWNLGAVQYHWPWLINRRLGTSYPTSPARYGRSLGYTDWLYGWRSSSGGGGGGPAATPRPTQRPSGSQPKPTDNPRGGGRASTSRSAETGHPTAAPPVADPTPTSSPGTAAIAGSAGQIADPGRAAATATSTRWLISAPFRQLVVGGLLVALLLWIMSAIVRLRAAPRQGRGGREAALR
jgi:hypothetical protein